MSLALLGWLAACNAPRYQGTPIAEFLQMVDAENAASREAEKPAVPSTRPALDTAEYRVGPSDVLQVTVYGLDSLEAPTVVPVRVSDAGTVALPLVGEIRVADQTLTAIEKTVAAAYSPRYIKNPRVLVDVKEYQLSRVLVVGGAGGAKEVALRRNERSVFQALGRAGAPFGAGQIVFVQPRSDPHKLEVFDLSRGQDMVAAVSRTPLEDGDIVMARPAPLPMIYVHGLTGGGALPMPETGLRLRQAIAAAGGTPTEFDADKVVLTRRMRDGRDVCVVFKWKNVLGGIEPDVELQPGDVIEVPHTADTRIEEFVRRAAVFRAGIDAVFDPFDYLLPQQVDLNSDYYHRQYGLRYAVLRDAALRASRNVTAPLLGP